jgi:hypothetical protein
MNDSKLRLYLNSIGKGCFVKYYGEFQDPAKSNEELIEILTKAEGYADKASVTKVEKSRSIIHAGRGADALLEIAQSTHVEGEVSAQAKKLLKKYHPDRV